MRSGVLSTIYITLMSLFANSPNFDSDDRVSKTNDITEPLSSIYTVDNAILDAYDVVKELIPFEQGFRSLSIRQMIVAFQKSFYAVLVLAPALFSRVLIDTSGFVFLNHIKDKDSQTLFGVYDTYYIVFNVCLMGSLVDKFSIDMSKAFGDKDYERVKKIFTQSGIVCLLLMILFTLPSVLFAKSVLMFIGVEEEKAGPVQDIAILALPMILINMVGEYIKSFCLSQGHEKILGYTSLVSMVLTVVANYYVLVNRRMGIAGWILTKTANEVISLFVTILVYFRTVPESRGLASVKEACEGFWSFFCEALKFMFSIYPECLGFELTMYFILLKRDDNQTAAYNCIVNITGIIFCFGIAFSIICRTRINILIGMKRKIAAKNFFIFFTVCTVFIGFLLGVSLYFTRSLLARAFSDSSDDMKHWFYRLLFIYSTVAGIQLAMCTIMVGMKTAGKVTVLLIINVIISLGGSLATGYIIYRHELPCDAQFTGYMALGNLLTVIVLIITLSSDWSTIKVDG